MTKKLADAWSIDRRWYDKLMGWLTGTIGAMSVIIWSLVWTTVTTLQGKVSMLEVESRVLEERSKATALVLSDIKEQLKIIALKIDERKN